MGPISTGFTALRKNPYRICPDVTDLTRLKILPLPNVVILMPQFASAE